LSRHCETYDWVHHAVKWALRAISSRACAVWVLTGGRVKAGLAWARARRKRVGWRGTGAKRERER
jgi:hypothetical protein